MYAKEQIKRIRLIKRIDGYYAQFCIDAERNEKCESTGKQVCLDVGINAFYTDSDGQKVDNPKYLRKAEKRLKKLQRRVSRRYQNPNKGKSGQ